jgi:hypothetical protein
VGASTCVQRTAHCPKTAACSLVPLMQRESIPYVTDTICVTSFLADFYALSVSASLEYAINITRKNPPKFKQF